MTVTTEVSLTDLLAIGLSIVAMIVAIWSARKANWSAEIANKLQSEALGIEKVRESERVVAERRASLRARFVSAGDSYMLTIANDGHAEARELDVFVDGEPISKNQMISNSDDTFPVIGAGAQVEYRFIGYDGMPRVYRVRLNWNDDSGTGRNWQSDLTLP
jgi:hypothetical protein